MSNKYQVLLIDPPWKYNSRANHKTRFRGGAEGHYSLMTDTDLAALPVSSIADESAVLFMWATFPRIEFALDLIRCYGFKYKTVGFTWCKLNPKNGQPFFGVGYYAKSNAEICLLATRGKTIKPATNSVSSLVLTPRREHSRKPDEVRQRIELMYPMQTKIELFAREKVDGWDCYGNEVASDIELAV